MAFQKAQSLNTALPLLNHLREGFSEEEFEKIYVDRAEVQKQLDNIVQSLERDYPGKFLLTGHKGVGKSTALTQLARTLQDRGHLWVVKLSVQQRLNLQDLQYSDIVLLLALEILEQCRDQNIDLSPHIVGRIEDWGQTIELVREEVSSGKTELKGEAEGGVSAGLPWSRLLSIKALLGISARVSKESSTRKVIRRQIESEFEQLLEVIDLLQAEINRQTAKRLVCLVDGTDRTDIPIAEALFLTNGKSISADLPCSVVYTFPVALQYSKKFNAIKSYFNESFPIPNFKVIARGWVNDPQEEPRRQQDMRLLREVITKRVEEDKIFDPTAVDKLVAYSGGVPRMLLQLANSACRNALTDHQLRITTEYVEAAIVSERQAFHRALTFVPKGLLRKIRDYHQIDRALDDFPQEEREKLEEMIPDLLHNLSVVEYVNGDVWYDLHPIVQDLV